MNTAPATATETPEPSQKADTAPQDNHCHRCTDCKCTDKILERYVNPPNRRYDCRRVGGGNGCQVTYENTHRGTIKRACFGFFTIAENRRDFHELLQSVKTVFVDTSDTPETDKAYLEGLEAALSAFLKGKTGGTP